MTAPELDLDAMSTRVSMLEALDTLTPDELDEYVSTESQLERMLFSRALGASTNCEFNDANALLDVIIEFNVTMREIADRELPRPDWDDDHLGKLRYIRAEADGMVLLMQAHKLGNNADAAIVNGDPMLAQECLRESLTFLNQLAEAHVSSSEFAQLRILIISALVPMYEALQHLRSGNFQGAHAELNEAIARFTELRDALSEESPGEDPNDQADYQDLCRELGEGLSSTLALQGLVDMMLAVQHGDFSEALDRARYAAPLYDASVTAAQAAGRPRNLIAVRETERAYLHGWLALCEAEQAIEYQDWDGCRRHLGEARERWNAMSRLVIRNVFVGVMAHRPDTSSLELLLRGTARRCERERRLTAQIDRLTQQLGVALGHNVAFYSSVTTSAQADAQASSQAEAARQEGPMSKINFNGPVSGVGAIGDGNRVVGPTITTTVEQPAGPMRDLTQLAAALVTLRDAMSGAPLGDAEQQSLDHLRDAESAARRSDEPEVRKHLAAAGRWALTVAEHLGLAAVTTAIRYAIGG